MARLSGSLTGPANPSRFRIVEPWLLFLAFAFFSSLVWLIRNWNARGPTDLWKDEDFQPTRRHAADRRREPERPDPHAGHPLIEIGYWSTAWDPERPHPDAFLDPDWSQTEREQVLRYLADGLELPWDGGPVETCVYCGAVLVVEELTDGTYVWPTGLVHYVREHYVRLPGLFVLHVQRTRASRAPDSADTFVEVGRRDTDWWNTLSGI